MLDAMRNLKKVVAQFLFYSACVAVFPVTCHSIFEKSKGPPPEGYEYVTVTGSVIPQLVRKGQGAATMSPTGQMSAEDFAKMQQKFQSAGKLPGGG